MEKRTADTRRETFCAHKRGPRSGWEWAGKLWKMQNQHEYEIQVKYLSSPKVFQAPERRNEHKNGALGAGRTEKPGPGKWKMENAGEQARCLDAIIEIAFAVRANGACESENEVFCCISRMGLIKICFNCQPLFQNGICMSRGPELQAVNI